MDKEIYEALKRLIAHSQIHKEGFGEPTQLELDIVTIEEFVNTLIY